MKVSVTVKKEIEKLTSKDGEVAIVTVVNIYNSYSIAVVTAKPQSLSSIKYEVSSFSFTFQEGYFYWVLLQAAIEGHSRKDSGHFHHVALPLSIQTSKDVFRLVQK